MAGLRIPRSATGGSPEADAHFIKRLTQVKGAILEAATGIFDKDTGKHNTKAQELYLQRFDRSFIPHSKRDVAMSGGVSVGLDLTKMTDAELDRLEIGLCAKAEDGRPIDGNGNSIKADD